MKPLIIGEAPSKNEPLPRPVEGRIGRRLASFAGISFEEFLERTERVNLLDVRQDTREKGFEFDMMAARKRAKELDSVTSGRHTILLGLRVAKAFGAEPSYFKWQTDGNRWFVVVPHPSGVNRWFNDVFNYGRMCEFMRRVL